MEAIWCCETGIMRLAVTLISLSFYVNNGVDENKRIRSSASVFSRRSGFRPSNR
jgi:hypothetical protein